MGKLEFPKFYGDDVQGWMYRIKQFFSIDEVHDDDNIKIVSIHLHDRALMWHLQYLKIYGENVTWPMYEEAILENLGLS